MSCESIGTIPGGVLGRLTILLFGLIAITGGRTWVKGLLNNDLTENLFDDEQHKAPKRLKVWTHILG